MNMITILVLLTVFLYLFDPRLDLLVVRKMVGITLFLEIFYLVGHYLMDGWPFPTPRIILHITVVTAMGVALGVLFSRLWPLPETPGLERVVRTFLIALPALGLGFGLHVLLQGAKPDIALYLIFPFSAWLGSGHFVEQDGDSEEGSESQNTQE